MAGFLSGKMKRKDLEEVYDEFSEFSLSSPARKIRRLVRESSLLGKSLLDPLFYEFFTGEILPLIIQSLYKISGFFAMVFPPLCSISAGHAFFFFLFLLF